MVRAPPEARRAPLHIMNLHFALKNITEQRNKIQFHPCRQRRTTHILEAPLRWPKSPQYCHLSPCKCFDFHSTPLRIDLYSIVYERSVCDEVMVLFWFWHTLHNCLLTREKSFVTGRKHGHAKICANFFEEQQNNA